ncbi:MAG: hypothetical protein CL572_01700 [Alphaproteobacteria bacterium]|nr:hypothetical protein [Alphaproteobacteria bacterium]
MSFLIIKLMNIVKKKKNYTLVFDSSGSIFIPKFSILVISDLHIGKSYSFAKHGNFLPPYDIDDTIERIKFNINLYNPKKIISLGDSFHENSTLKVINNSHIKKINKIFKNIEVYLIDGNHDAELKFKEKINAFFKESLKLGNFNFKHIKDTQNVNNLFEFSGHFHPKVTIRFNKVRYSFKCFVLGENFCILPSFGTFTGGLNINSNVLKKILPKKKTIIALGKSKLIEI